jgi:hypothetical protein
VNIHDDSCALTLTNVGATVSRHFQNSPLRDFPNRKEQLDVESMRKEKRITSGASIVIKNVLPFSLKMR